MESIVEQIIRSIDGGRAFDSHYVIETIIREHSDDYLTFAANHPAAANVTSYVHGQIAGIIATFDGELVQRLPYESFSYNIRGNASCCALWLKI